MSRPTTPRVKALVSQVTRADTRPSKPFQPDPARVIAEADAAASRLATGQAPYPAERRGARASVVGAPVGNKVVRWAPIDEADDVTAPALFVLAQKEELFSNTYNGQLACERVKGPRKMVMLPEITHYDIYVCASGRGRSHAAIDWFDRYLKPQPAGARDPRSRQPQGTRARRLQPAAAAAGGRGGQERQRRGPQIAAHIGPLQLTRS